MTPKIDLEPYHRLIEVSVNEGVSHSKIRSLLKDRYGVECSRATLVRALNSWDLRSPFKAETWQDNDDLRAKVRHSFAALRLTDAEVVTQLDRNEKEFVITPRRLGKLRREMGLFKTVPRELFEAAHEQNKQLIMEDVDRGIIEDYGYRHLYQHLRTKYNIIGRDRMLELSRELDPSGPSRRITRSKGRVNRIRAPGPNHTWSVDAYCKLEHFGVQIYCAIDTYSRYVVWSYIGISARSQVSVVSQYLATIKESAYLPRLITSDRGAETVLLADAHFNLMNESCELQGSTDTARFKNCYRYGTSKANQRIEAWWSQMSKTAMKRWHLHFKQLSDSHQYDKTLTSDRIAFLAVYMPLLKEALSTFVRSWNYHTIRTDKRNEHAVGGIPWRLFHEPWSSNAQSHAVVVDPELIVPYQEEIGGFDMEEYLPHTTLTWCEDQLHQHFGDDLPDSTRFCAQSQRRYYHEYYLLLRDLIANELESGNTAELHESDRPNGARRWIERSRTTVAGTAAARWAAIDDVENAQPGNQ